MMLPTRSIRSAATPSASRLASASGDGVHRTSASASVTMRLISSGIVRSRLRKPASRCATGMPSFGADQGAGQGRIDVADDDDPIRTRRVAQPLVGDHHAAGLLRVAAAAHAEVMIRIGQTQIAEERIGHIGVVVLTGMHQDGTAPWLVPQPVPQRCDLHEIGPGGGNQMCGDLRHIGLEDRSASELFKRGRGAMGLSMQH